ncbi:MAG: alginate export family protein [Crocinitomicaceae bacterium]|nr:alginate export family protein [Crocinitomicaceae bacterium]
MRFNLKGVLVGTAFVLVGSSSFSQFNLSGEVRPRAEFRNGYKTLPDTINKPAFFISQRTRLKFRYDHEKFTFFVSLQDVRTWGNQKQLVANEANAVSLHEAWGLVRFGKKWGMKFGRQEVNYDDQRMFGAVNWTQQARSHDMLMFKFMGDKFKLDVAGAYNQSKENLFNTIYTTTGNYKVESHIWANYNIKDKVKISGLVLMLGQQVSFIDSNLIQRNHDNYSLTMGTHVNFKLKDFGGEFNGFYQLGSTATQVAKSISAFNFKLDLYYKVKNFKFTLGYEILSGQGQTDTSASYGSVSRSFNPFFGTNHKFNGFMDYFFVGNHLGTVGLQDAYFKFAYKHEKFNIGLDAHGFFSAAPVLDQNHFNTTGEYKGMHPFIGLELDLSAGVKIAKWTSLKLGYSQMFSSATMAALKGGDRTLFNNWAYVMIVFNPTIFDQKAFQEKKAKKEADK